MNAVFDRLQRLLVLAASRTDLVLAVMIVAIVFMMILPLPLGWWTR
jgi:type III secretion protein V